MKLVFACEDAGGARALAPVVRELFSRGHQVVPWLGEVAARIFREEGLWPATTPITDARAAEAEIRRPDAFAGAEVLLCTSTSWGVRLEARAVRSAREHGCRSVCFIDAWASYLGRLSFPGESDLGALSDVVLVVDTAMADACRAIGVPEATIVVTGSPAFERLGGQGLPPPLASERRILFLSQPIASLYGETEENPRFLGYTEKTTLALVAEIADALGARLVVRAHPREDSARLSELVSRLPASAEMDQSRDLRAALSAASVVVGMTTVALCEAALLGRRTISAQVRARSVNRELGGGIGHFCVVEEEAALRLAVENALAEGPSLTPRSLESHVGATARIVAAIERSA